MHNLIDMQKHYLSLYTPTVSNKLILRQNNADFSESKETEYEIEVRDNEESNEDEYEIKDSRSEHELPQKATKAESDCEYAQVLSRVAKQREKKRHKKDITIDGTEKDKLGNGCVDSLPSHLYSGILQTNLDTFRNLETVH